MRAPRLVRVVVVAGSVALVAACGGSGSSPSQESPSPTPGVTAAGDETQGGVDPASVDSNEAVVVDEALQDVIDELESLEADLDDLDVLSGLIDVGDGG